MPRDAAALQVRPPGRARMLLMLGGAGCLAAATILVFAVRRHVSRAPETAFSNEILATHRRGGRFVVARAPVAVRMSAGGFRLADDRGCRLGGDEGYCAAALPKPWSQEELAEMSALLTRMRSRGLGPFLQQILRNGFDTMIRVTSVVHYRPGERWPASPYPNSLLSNGQLVIADRRFRVGKGERPLLHLLAHAYDFGGRHGDFFLPTLSHSQDFLRMTGFFVNKEGGWDLRDMPRPQRVLYRELFDRTNHDLLLAGNLRDARERERREADIRSRAELFAQNYPAPSFHSLLNPYESFAEWCTLVYEQPDRAKAINPELAIWIREKVFDSPALSGEPRSKR